MIYREPREEAGLASQPAKSSKVLRWGVGLGAVFLLVCPRKLNEMILQGPSGMGLVDPSIWNVASDLNTHQVCMACFSFLAVSQVPPLRSDAHRVDQSPAV